MRGVMMNKRNVLLAGLVVFSGMAFSAVPEFNENEEVCIYDDAKKSLYIGLGATVAGAAVIALLASGKLLTDNIFQAQIKASVVIWGAIGCLGGLAVACSALRDMWNSQPSLIVNKEGFQYYKTFYSWNDVEKMRTLENTGYICQKVFFKNKTEPIEIPISDKLKSAEEIIKLMEDFYHASKKNK